jgi:hypothetical protein
MATCTNRFGLSRSPRSRWIVAGVLTGALLCLPAARPSTALPEPSAALVFGVGCLLVGTVLRKRSR